MAELELVLICERALVEQDSQTLSIIRIVEQVKVPRPDEALDAAKPPVVPFAFSVVHQWRKTDRDLAPFKVRIRLELSNGKEFAKGEAVVDLSVHPVGRHIINVPGFPLIGPGPISVLVQRSADGNRWKTAARRSFDVIFVDPHTP